MGRMLSLAVADVARLRDLIEVQQVPQRIAAERLGWPLRRVERVIARLHLTTQHVGRFSGPAYDPRWKGGVTVDHDGYRLRYCPGHPFGRTHTKYVLEHRLVMEEMLGRYLHPTEVVHHRNKRKQDNRPENLQLFASNADHLRAELTGHRPHWTTSGIARIQAGVQRWRASHEASAHDAQGRRRTTPRSTV